MAHPPGETCALSSPGTKFGVDALMKVQKMELKISYFDK